MHSTCQCSPFSHSSQELFTRQDWWSNIILGDVAYPLPVYPSPISGDSSIPLPSLSINCKAFLTNITSPLPLSSQWSSLFLFYLTTTHLLRKSLNPLPWRCPPSTSPNFSTLMLHLETPLSLFFSPLHTLITSSRSPSACVPAFNCKKFWVETARPWTAVEHPEYREWQHSKLGAESKNQSKICLIYDEQLTLRC